MNDDGRIVRGRWGRLLDELAAALPARLGSPFARARVVVATHAVGKVASQQLAALLGISAGVSFPTLGALERELAERAGVARDRARWLGSPLDLAVLRAMSESDSPLVRRALDTDRPGQRTAAAARFARVLRHYAEHAPQLIDAWLAGDDGELTDEFAWQPEVARGALEALEVDPGEIWLAMEDAAAADETPTFLLAVEDVSTRQQRLLTALSPLCRLIPDAAQPGAPASHPDHQPRPAVELHDSHSDARQVEVLRDELVRAFANDPTLQPRDVLIVTPRPRRYAHLLDAAFAESHHPAAQLRVQRLGGAADGNPVLGLLARVLRLGESRATASELADLLLSPAVAHRWRLGDGADLRELIVGAGIRWGLDAAQRTRFELSGVTQNTWLRGLDRLLIGLTAGQEDVGLGLTGAEAVSASDMALLGSLAELISRLRRIVARTHAQASLAEWVALTREIVTDLFGVPQADEWQLVHAHSTLTRMAREHGSDETQLTRYEFARLLTDEQAHPKPRVAAGNGALHVVPLGELLHVEHRVVAMLGLTDDVLPGPAGIPDALDLPEAPDPRARRLAQLLGHARSAERLIIVRQGFSAHTGRPESSPVAVEWLLRELGVAPVPVPHPAAATSEAAFRGAHPSFDVGALEGALARRRGVSRFSAAHRRRQEARREPLPERAEREVTLAQLARFLDDPAKAFLRSRGGIVRFAETELADELPIRVDGLTRWQVIEEVLEALRRGEGVDDVERRIRHSELLPPREIGRAGFQEAVADAQRLWRRSADARSAPAQVQEIDLTVQLGSLGTVRLLDQVVLHGACSVTETASKSDSRLIRPWLDCLALNASGSKASAQLSRFAPYPAKGEVTTVEFADPEDPLTALTAVLRAWVIGSSRLLPVPAEPGLAYARQFLTRFDPHAWQGPTGWRSVWPRLGDSWPLFYDQDLADLVSDTLIETDPVNSQSRAFAAWAVELYVPMLRSAR